jgi:peptidoglycan glycosyltransferase
VIISAAALQTGTPEHRDPGRLGLPGSAARSIRNAEDEVCPGARITLKEALTESCNTGFAQLGVEARPRQGEEDGAGVRLRAGRPDVGNLEDGGLPVAASHTGDIANPDGSADQGALAQSSIGQRDVRMTRCRAR